MGILGSIGLFFIAGSGGIIYVPKHLFDTQKHDEKEKNEKEKTSFFVTLKSRF
jgi:predicted mannosyl-3-phosphoglycerate phosphatase (HAD superfamily)